MSDMTPPFEELAVADDARFDLVQNADGTPKWGEANSDYVDILIARQGLGATSDDTDAAVELASDA